MSNVLMMRVKTIIFLLMYIVILKPVYCDRHLNKSLTSIYEACYLQESFINVYEVLVPEVLTK